MKKFLLSFSVIFSFIAYSALQRSGILSNQSVYTVPQSKETAQPNLPPAVPGQPLIRAGVFGDDFLGGEDDEDGFVPRKTSVIPAQNSPAQTAPSAGASGISLGTAAPAAGTYRDGQYTGPIADAYYGNVQVQVVVSGGKINDVRFLDYPHDRNNSIRINNYAMPILKQEAIAAQTANVDIVSGATATSDAFLQSFAGALAQAK